MSRRIKMLRQVNEPLFLYFEVPRWNGTSRSNLCNAQKLADDVRAYSFIYSPICATPSPKNKNF